MQRYSSKISNLYLKGLASPTPLFIIEHDLCMYVYVGWTDKEETGERNQDVPIEGSE